MVIQNFVSKKVIQKNAKVFGRDINAQPQNQVQPNILAAKIGDNL